MCAVRLRTGQLMHSAYAATRDADGFVMNPNHILQSLTFRNSAGEWRLPSLGGRDSLTGCWSAAAFGLHISAWSQLPVGLVYVDIPGLIWVNDRMGQEAGDLLIRDVAYGLARTFPPEPEVVLARSGGDEFCALTTNLNSLERLADQARDVLAKPRYLRARSRVEDPDDVLHVTLAAFGVATATGQPGWELEELIARATTGMYSERSGFHERKPTMIEAATDNN